MKEFNDAMTMPDRIEKTANGSMLQHGKLNNRIYLMKLAAQDMESIIHHMDQLADKQNYSKIFCKIPSSVYPLFLSEGYRMEGYIPAFYNGKEDAFFVSKFPNDQGRASVPVPRLQQLHRLLSDMATGNQQAIDKASYTIRKLDQRDIPAMTRIYSDIFKSYPFPIYDPEYISEMMDEHVQYFGAFKDGKLAALSSSEIDMEAQNAEMTDFATHTSHTGNKLSMLLLRHMEHEMRQQGIYTLYTIARLQSIPMNKTIIRTGFTYSGTLLNNTNIDGKTESMNLYYKRLEEI